MAVFVALLRAVNVGGTGKLPMSDLKSLCVAAGFSKVQTYIASGNVILESSSSAAKIKSTLQAAMEKYAGKPVGVLVRSVNQMQDILRANPFSDRAGNRTVAIFLDKPANSEDLANVKGRKDEEIQLGKCEIYVYYGEGMAQSKLNIPAAKSGTARNMNTVAKLTEILLKVQGSA